MEPVKKNRMRMEEVEDFDPSITQYETEEYNSLNERKGTKSSSFNIFLIFLSIVLILAICYAGYYIYTNQNGLVANKDKRIELIGNKQVGLGILDRPYLPESSLNPKLANCINLYKSSNIKEARTKCEDFLNSPGEDTEKSIALTVLGAIYDGQARYDLAIENLLKAINYDKSNVYAYYDLALSYIHNGEQDNARKVLRKAKSVAPNDSKILNLLGNIENETNDPDAAIRNYKEAIEASPNDGYSFYNLALTQYKKKGSTVEAIENFRKAILVNPSGQIAELSHSYLGSIYYHRDDLEAAEHHYREALAISPNESKYLYNVGLILMRKKKTEDAISFFQKAIDSGSTDPQVFRFIAEAFETLRMYDNAAVALEKALRTRPDDVDSMFQLADLYYNRGNLSQAEDLYRRIIKNTPGDSNTENALINLGIILDDMERFTEAVNAFEKVVDLNAKNDSAYYHLGIAYKHAGQPTKALEAWKKAVALNPNEPKNQEVIGDYYYEAGYFLESASEFESISKAYPNNYKIKLKLADAYFKLKSFDNAEKSLIYVLNNSKDGTEIKKAHRKLALVYSESDPKNKSKAKDEAYRGSHIDPEDMESRLVLAKVLIDSNSLMDREKAIDELTAITRSEVKPKIAAQAYNYLGLCYYKNAEYKKAMREFQNAIDQDPSFTEAFDNKRAARASYEDSIQGRSGLR
ncbi:MAG: tetratricopeptide repeat protein [Leptospiraceae bacterium]|nr:tetratricopeptide repeat protein [Leptospiraceae bacterium]